MEYHFQPIGRIQSPFKDKFGVPRQPSLVQAARGKVILDQNPDLVTAVKGLESFSHLWILFVFHQHGGKKWKPSIRPPRLGGREKVGVLASRSPHRPNPIGISVAKIEQIVTDNSQVQIEVSGLDLIDGTPVLDIKPYIPYADAIPEASSGWANSEIKKYPVKFSKQAKEYLRLTTDNGLYRLIEQVLEIDPRPAYAQREKPIGGGESCGLKYGIEISGHEIKYEILREGFLVHSVSLNVEMKS